MIEAAFDHLIVAAATLEQGEEFIESRLGARPQRGGKHVAKEGSSRSRNVVLEFKDYETALACYDSPEYARLLAIRSAHADSDLLIIEGYDGPQP